MEGLEDRIVALRGLRSRFRSVDDILDYAQHDGAFREEVRDVYRLLYGAELSGCVRCIADAYIRVVRSVGVKNEK